MDLLWVLKCRSYNKDQHRYFHQYSFLTSWGLCDSWVILSILQGDKEGNDRRARILVYLRHLFTFHGISHYNVRKAGADPGRFSQDTGIPGIIVSSFLDRFTGESSIDASNKSEIRLQSKQHKDLLLSYCLVLGLAVDDFQTDPYDMALELKQTVNALRPYYRELGCKFEARSIKERRELGDPDSAQGKWRVTLPVPLKFPEIVTARGKGGPRRWITFSLDCYQVYTWLSSLRSHLFPCNDRGEVLRDIFQPQSIPSVVLYCTV